MSCINFKKPTLQLFGSNTAMTLQFNKRLRLTDILMVRLFFNGIFAKHAARPIIRGCLEWKNLTQWVHRVAGKKGSIRGVRKWHSGQQKNEPTNQSGRNTRWGWAYIWKAYWHKHGSERRTSFTPRKIANWDFAPAKANKRKAPDPSEARPSGQRITKVTWEICLILCVRG